MKESRFLYKCRKCGKIDNSICTAETNAMSTLTEVLVFGESISGRGIKVTMEQWVYQI